MTMQIPINPEARVRRRRWRKPLIIGSILVPIAALTLFPAPKKPVRPYGGTFYRGYPSPDNAKSVLVFVHRQGALGSDYIWVVRKTPAEDLVVWKGYVEGSVERWGGDPVRWLSQDQVIIKHPRDSRYPGPDAASVP